VGLTRRCRCRRSRTRCQCTRCRRRSPCGLQGRCLRSLPAVQDTHVERHFHSLVRLVSCNERLGLQCPALVSQACSNIHTRAPTDPAASWSHNGNVQTRKPQCPALVSRASVAGVQQHPHESTYGLCCKLVPQRERSNNEAVSHLALVPVV